MFRKKWMRCRCGERFICSVKITVRKDGVPEVDSREMLRCGNWRDQVKALADSRR